MALWEKRNRKSRELEQTFQNRGANPGHATHLVYSLPRILHPFY
jgi:hypothetical protein